MVDPDLGNWHRIDDRLTTSGRPDECGVAALATMGVTTVINLALHSHPRALADEAAIVAAAGMRYVHIPVEFAAPTATDFAAFAEAMIAHHGERVHVHCIVNARVSAFVYRYRVERLGVPPVVAAADLDALWRPGGVWSRFVGRTDEADQPHRPGTGPNCASVA